MSNLTFTKNEYKDTEYVTVCVTGLTEKDTFFKNFDGSKNSYTGQTMGPGFSIRLTQEQADILSDLGFRIKYHESVTRMSDSGTEYTYDKYWSTDIKIRWEGTPPKIYYVREDKEHIDLGKEDLREYNDRMYLPANANRLHFGRLDFSFNRKVVPYHNHLTGETYHTAYLRSLALYPAVNSYSDPILDNIKKEREEYLAAMNNADEVPFA